MLYSAKHGQRDQLAAPSWRCDQLRIRLQYRRASPTSPHRHHSLRSTLNHSINFGAGRPYTRANRLIAEAIITRRWPTPCARLYSIATPSFLHAARTATRVGLSR